MVGRTGWAALTIGAALLAGGTVQADTQAGVAAWQRGDYARAIAEWRPAAVAGDADAQFNLGQAYKLGHGVPVDPAQAIQWYRRAAQQGHLPAEDNLGLLLFQQGQRADALPYLQHSAGRGEPRAQLIFGTMLYNGDGVPRDFPRAYALVVRAAAQGLPQAAQVQAQMDQYVPAADRQRGLAMARDLEAAQQRPQLPAEVAATRPTAPPPPSPATPAQPAATPALPRPSVARLGDAAAPAPVAHPNPPATGRGWRIQLGAFHDDGNAQRLFASVSSRLAGAQPFYVRAGAITRLQVGPYASSGEATRACAAVRPTPCVPVAP